MRFAQLTFRLAAIYGVVSLVPMYFMEQRIGRDFPPPITHPEYFYGFVGVALAWQFAFFVIAKEPVRYRAFMPIAVFEKGSFGIAALLLFYTGRLSLLMLAAGVVDLMWAAMFLIAMRKTAPVSVPVAA